MADKPSINSMIHLADRKVMSILGSLQQGKHDDAITSVRTARQILAQIEERLKSGGYMGGKPNINREGKIIRFEEGD